IWFFNLFFVFIPGCFPSCLITGPVASCASKKLRSVPPLPRNITHLYLEMNYISEINSTSLTGLEELQELDLGRQRVPLVIRNEAFSGQRRLKRLILGFNVGLQLEPLAFEGLSGLCDLHLDYCSLNDSILSGPYLEPLSALETLDLFGNQIMKLQPSLFFANMTELKVLNLKLNKIGKICESDLIGFRGKRFTVLNMNSVRLKKMSNYSFDWQKCGNPFRGMSFETLDLSYTGLSVGQIQHFFTAIKGTNITHLKLSGHIGKGFSFNNLPDPDHRTFEGLKSSSVFSLDLSQNRIFALQQGVFSPLRDAVTIDVSQNRLNQIHRGAFNGLHGHLKMLNLSHNLLGEVYSHTFVSLANLRVLDLSHNHIGVLGFGSFSGLSHLEALNLAGNSLRDLGFPATLPSLNYITLNDNKLTSVRTFAWFAVNIVHLDIRGNRLTNLEDVYSLVTQMKPLQRLLYGGNSIRWCTPGGQVGLNKLELLDLHSSSLQTVWALGTCLDLFDNLGNVTKMNLSSNGLRSLPQGVFKGLTSLVELDLSSNTLTHLQSDVFPQSVKVLHLASNFIASPDPASFGSLRFLDLGMNRFHCDSNLRSFLTWLNRTEVTLSSPAQELRCEFPLRFQNVPLLDYQASWLRKE
uniref:Toll-like receptor 5 n=1 Tax=Salarias fasciatus TaxID=181472 RepID=A0A672IN32_SALFA